MLSTPKSERPSNGRPQLGGDMHRDLADELRKCQEIKTTSQRRLAECMEIHAESQRKLDEYRKISEEVEAIVEQIQELAEKVLKRIRDR